MTCLIKNAHWINGGHADVEKGDLLIEEGRIKKILPLNSPPEVEMEVIDAKGQLILPGMTNAHYHSYSNLIKGTEHNLPLEIWSLYTVAYGHALTDEDIYLAVLLGAAEMIRSGSTGCIDHFPHLSRAEAALKAHKESGMNVAFAPMLHDIPDHQFLKLDLPVSIKNRLEATRPLSPEEMHDYYDHLIHKWHKNNGKIHIMLGPNAPQRCSVEYLYLCSYLSQKYSLNVHTHLLETEIQKKFGDDQYQRGLIGRMEQTGLLNDRLSAAHAIWLNDYEIDLLKEHGVSVVHNPASNLTLGSGNAPLIRYLQKGIPVGLGTDASNCGSSHSLFETMRFAAMMHRIGEKDPQNWPKANQVFEMAAVHGANLMDDNLRGKIMEGYDADLVFLTKDTTTWGNTFDDTSQLVFHENGSSIDSVMIRGEWVLKNKEILTFDERKVIDRVQQRAEELKGGSRQSVKFADEIRPYAEKFYYTFINGRNLT